MNEKHEHIRALLAYEIQKRLEDLERRGVGFIDVAYNGGIDYRIDGVIYHIRIEEAEQ